MTAQYVTKKFLDQRFENFAIKINKNVNEKIEELAVIVKTGFDELSGQVDRLEVDVADLNKRLAKCEL